MELHVIQSFAPSNLNRDDVGAPKSCTFGGVPRARISSQCLKRTAREFVRDMELLKQEEMAERSRRFVSEVIAPRLQERLNLQEESAEQIARAGLAAIGGFTQKGEDSGGARGDTFSEYLLFLAPREVDELIE